MPRLSSLRYCTSGKALEMMPTGRRAAQAATTSVAPSIGADTPG